MAQILYWNGIIDPQGLSDTYQAIIQKLISGNYHSLNLEKLHGYNVYSVRDNRETRLLFTTVRVDDKPYLMVLEEVLNHDYHKSRFLKPGVLRNYLELNGEAIDEEVRQKHFETYTAEVGFVEEAADEDDTEISYEGVDYYNQQFIRLDDTQQGVVRAHRLPLIISGAAGSGKSCLALQLLSQYVEGVVQSEASWPIVYVTEPNALVQVMQRGWHSLPIAQGLPEDAVQFKSYDQLVKELEPELAQKTFVGKAHCYEWLKEYIKRDREVAKATKQASIANPEFLEDIEALYQEFRILSACRSLAEYEALGARESLFIAKEERQWLYTAYTKYQEVLTKEECVHTAFYTLSVKDRYKRVIVDESQDLSRLKIHNLYQLALNRQICFCEDARQNLSTNKPIVPYISRLMHASGQSPNHTQLTASHRCPQAVTELANVLSRLKSRITGHGQLDMLTSNHQSEKGHVQWLDDLTASELDRLKKKHNCLILR